MAFLSSLPMMAVFSRAAQSELVEVSTEVFTELSDGSLQVTLANGSSLIVAPGDWTIAGGRVYIENSVLASSGVGASASIVRGDDKFSVFGVDVNPWALTGGALAAGYLTQQNRGDSNSDSNSGSGGSTTSIQPSGISLTGNITNATATADDAGQSVINDISTIFTGASGSVSYQIAVTDSAGAGVTDLVYLNGSQLLILSDPKVAKNGIYTVKVTGTDTAGNSAEANVFVSVNVSSEASTNGTMANETMDHNDAANAVVVSDVSVYFKDAEGTFSYEVSVKSGAQDYGNVLQFSGNSLVLSNAITDDFVELLNGTKGDEDITLAVTVTATDSADSKKLTQTFNLTLNATGVNDAPELAPGMSSTVILNQDSSGGTLAASDTVNLNLAALNLVTDEENNDLLWAITSNTPSGLLSINQTTGVVTGSVIAGDDAQNVTIDVTDASNPTTPVSLTLYIDFTG